MTTPNGTAGIDGAFHFQPAPLTITTTSLPPATLGASYLTAIVPAGGSPTAAASVTTYAFSATGLPAGLSISSSGVISGTPTQAGSFPVTITLKDTRFELVGGTTVTKTLTLNVAPAVSLITASLPFGSAGSAYSAPLAASGGTAPYRFTASGLPPGLSVVGSAITGTPTQMGNATVPITVTDSTPVGNGGPFVSTPVSLPLSIGQGSQVVTFTSTVPATPAVGGTYLVTATGGASVSPVIFSIDAGSTPGACATVVVNTPAKPASAAKAAASGKFNSASAPTGWGSLIDLTGIGTCIINADQAFDDNYGTAETVQQSFTIGKASQTITFTKPADTTIGGGAVALAATASSGLSVAFASTTPVVCTVSGNTATLVAPGQCSITATQPGNANYGAAAAVTQSFTIGKASQTIAFAKPADIAFSTGATVALQATASSGLPVTFASTTTGICTVLGNTATLLAPGSCSITASQAGNANTLAASDVVQSFTVLGTPTLTLAVAASPSMIGAVGQSVAYTYTVTNSGNVPVTGVGVTDARVSGITCSASSLAANAVATCTGSTVSTAADIASRGIASTATARAMFNNAPVTSTAVATTVGIDIAKVQAATKSAISGLLAQRGNVLASSGPDTGRTHDRLAGGTLLGGADGSGGDGAAPAGIASKSGSSGVLKRYGLDASGSGGAGSGGRGFGGQGLGADASSPVLTNPLGRFGRNGRPARGLADEPDLPPGMNRDQPETASSLQRAAPGGFAFTGRADDTMGRFQFSASLSKFRAAAEAAEREKLASADRASLAAMGLNAGNVGERPSRPALFDVWLEGSSSYFKTGTGDGRRQGHAAVIATGADMLVWPGLLVGFLGQADWMADRSTTLGQDRDGRGWMAGPYMSARLTPNLYVDARGVGPLQQPRRSHRGLRRYLHDRPGPGLGKADGRLDV